MKLTVEPTNEIVCVDGVYCRVWLATAPSGTVAAFVVAGVALPEGADASEFDAELIPMGNVERADDGTFEVRPDADAEEIERQERAEQLADEREPKG